jgi:hypothetical protein
LHTGDFNFHDWYTCPGVDIYGRPHNFTVVDPAINFFSIDMYHFDGKNAGAPFVSTVKAFYEQYVYTKLHGSQKGMYDVVWDDLLDAGPH